MSNQENYVRTYRDGLFFMTGAHEAVKQVRKYTGRPYYEHPMEVAELISKFFPDDEDMALGALLHDVVEDTGVTYKILTLLFGFRVAMLVKELTDVGEVGVPGGRAARVEANFRHTLLAGPEARNIKCADIYSNSKDIVANDRKFAAIYLPEKRRVLDAIREGCHPELWELASRAVDEGLEAINAGR